jgi:fatty acyl-CoA reductase
VSSAYVNADRTGYLHEKIYESKKDWANDYEKITNSRRTEISYNEKLFMGAFPNSMSYSKSMAERLLVERNVKNIPLSIVRPGFIGASAEEPVPAWTDG